MLFGRSIKISLFRNYCRTDLMKLELLDFISQFFTINFIRDSSPREWSGGYLAEAPMQPEVNILSKPRVIRFYFSILHLAVICSFPTIVPLAIHRSSNAFSGIPGNDNYN